MSAKPSPQLNLLPFSEEIGYMARVLVQTSLPLQETAESEWWRTNGNLRIGVVTPSSLGGVPYGSYPRLIVAWITTHAKRRREREFFLGRSQAEFMRTLGIPRGGGPNGSFYRLQEQLKRLAATSFHVIDDGEDAFRSGQALIFRETHFWWDRSGRGRAYVRLDEEFYSLLRDKAIPISIDAVKQLSNSPLALDLYFLATYRAATSQGNGARIPLHALREQWGSANQSNSSLAQAIRRAAYRVARVYAESNGRIDIKDGYLHIQATRPHVLRSL